MGATQIWVLYNDDKTAIVGIFGGPQPQNPNAGITTTDDPLYKTFYDALPPSDQQWWPAPTLNGEPYPTDDGTGELQGM